MQVINQIGRGGFGNVDLVQDAVGAQYARKTFSINQTGNFPADLAANVKRRFIREAEVQAAISHFNIMPVVFTELHNDPPSFIMPVALSSLDRDIATDKSLNGSSMRAVMDILAGLEELHQMGITHRDLKPQNVLRLVNSDGDRYVISDFGLMSLRDTQVSVLTQTGMRMGSDYYTAPEIVADLKMATTRSDIYSVGCIMHDLFGTTPRIPCNEINEDGFYADIFRSCTRRDPARRFLGVSDLREAILSLGNGYTSTESQINDFLALLNGPDNISQTNWERIVNKIEATYPSADAKGLLDTLSMQRIQELIQLSPLVAARLGVVYGKWVSEVGFDFNRCDGIGNRLAEFMAIDDYNCQAEVILAFLAMGTSHNRWYVEKKFIAACGPAMPEGLAKRVAMELRVLGKIACARISHLEKSIGVDRGVLHPYITSTLHHLC